MRLATPDLDPGQGTPSLGHAWGDCTDSAHANHHALESWYVAATTGASWFAQNGVWSAGGDPPSWVEQANYNEYQSYTDAAVWYDVPSWTSNDGLYYGYAVVDDPANGSYFWVRDAPPSGLIASYYRAYIDFAASEVVLERVDAGTPTELGEELMFGSLPKKERR